MTNTDIAYIAGIFDGEGTINMLRDKRGIFHVGMNVSSSNEKLIDWLIKTTGMGRKYDLRNGMYHWQPRNLDRVNFLKLVFPYLRIKRRQARLILIYYAGPWIYDHNCFTGVPDCEVERRTRIMVLLKKLNGRKTTPYVRKHRPVETE